MRVCIGADHRGVQMKEMLLTLVRRLGHEAQDAGAQAGESVDYPDVAAAVGHRVAGGQADRGILICGTGIGMAISANKVPGIRAATCSDEVTAALSRRHNDVNVLCLSGDLLGKRNLDNLIEVWLDAPFEGGRHARRVNKIKKLEQACGSDDPPGVEPA